MSCGPAIQPSHLGLWFRFSTVRGTKRRHRGHTLCRRPPWHRCGAVRCRRGCGRGGSKSRAGSAEGGAGSRCPALRTLVSCLARLLLPGGSQSWSNPPCPLSVSVRFRSHVHTELGCARRFTGLRGILPSRNVPSAWAAWCPPQACSCCLSSTCRLFPAALAQPLLSHCLHAARVFPNKFQPYPRRQAFLRASGCIQRGSHFIVLAVLKLTMQTNLARNSQKSVCLCLPSAGMKAFSHSWKSSGSSEILQAFSAGQDC
ncbi:uncharacterized protein LOC128113528 [Peromyscus californicus insignis]|uniref:uncharacterized protein LOC128113528 n=1 Tax=Peromyscus californicus insignis TaxID=564181 RepID=UPI0022A79B37|nr:uncharacterized protein LOC128113528 [Peromyscus californicus insignis]